MLGQQIIYQPIRHFHASRNSNVCYFVERLCGVRFSSFPISMYMRSDVRLAAEIVNITQNIVNIIYSRVLSLSLSPRFSPPLRSPNNQFNRIHFDTIFEFHSFRMLNAKYDMDLE